MAMQARRFKIEVPKELDRTGYGNISIDNLLDLPLGSFLQNIICLYLNQKLLLNGKEAVNPYSTPVEDIKGEIIDTARNITSNKRIIF